MIFKKFDKSEIVRNTIKVYPNNSIFIDSTGSIFLRSQNQYNSASANNSNLYYGSIINTTASRYSLTSDIISSDPSVSPLLPNGSSPYYFNNFNNFTINKFLSSSISAFQITASEPQSVPYLRSLTNTINWYASLSPSYNFSNIFSRISSSEINVINIPSIFYGSSIKKGSVVLDFYITGTLVGRATDYRMNGELVEITGSSTGSVAGLILYEEGLLLMTGSWNITTAASDRYVYSTSSGGFTTATDFPKWKHFGKNLLSSSLTLVSNNQITFQGTDYINCITMFAHADKSEFNTSNNKTFIANNQAGFATVFTSSNQYVENSNLLIANTIKTNYPTISGSFKKQTFINTIGIYDQDKKLIAVAKLATPVKKNNEREYTFKLKLDT